MTVRLMGLPTRETNSSQASSSEGPAQRHTTSFSDKDEYRVGLSGLDICYRLIRVVSAVGYSLVREQVHLLMVSIRESSLLLRIR